MRGGLFALAAALVVAVVLAQSGVAPGYRSLAFVPFAASAYGVLSSLYGVCGISALAGRRITTEGAERIASRVELSAQRRSGLRVIAMSLALAGIATTLFVLAS